MRSGWTSASLESCIEDVAYTTKIQRKDFLPEGKYPVISQEEAFINGYWNDDRDVFRVRTPLVVFGDHTKALKYVDFDFVLGADGVKLLQPLPVLEPRFFYYQLQALIGQIESLGYARHYRLLRELEIVYPSVPEQRRIVAILDKAFESIAIARANAEKNLQNARELFDAFLAQIFASGREGWCERFLEQVVDEHCSLSYGIVQPGDDSPGGLPVVRPVDLTTKVIGLEGLKRVRKQVAESYQRTELRGGELLLCVRGTTGTVAMASPELKGANVTRGIVPVAFNRSLLDPEFGYYLMSSAPVQEQIQAKTYGAALMQINIRDLRAIRVAFPALSEQRAIRKRLDQVFSEHQRLESIYRRKLAALDELKQSLLHHAFSGQL